MADELVSIIMPAYNSEDTISESIDSAVSQTYRNIELIVVDDGSTDKTADICKVRESEDHRIRYVRQSNMGVSAARNTGIRMARGDFIAFLDADDLWEQDKIELQMAVSSNQPDAVILTEVQRFSGDSPSKILLPKKFPPQYTIKDEYIRTILNLENVQMACFGTALVRKAHLEVVGLFDENLTTGEDWDLWLRLAFHYPFANIDKPLRLYRDNPGSLTARTKLKKTFHCQLHIIDKAKHYGPLAPSEIPLAKMRKYLEFAIIYRYYKKWWASLQCLVWAIGSCPAGCGKLIWKKFINRSSRILRGMNNV
jgi:glycosyltransferase involved in cell wall biosynthesis